MQNFWQALKTQRWDDHRYYHHSRINQSLHLLSATSFVCAYGLMVYESGRCGAAAWLVSMTSRQAGHFFFEPKGYDVVNQATHEHKEEIKVGYNLRRKVVLMAIWALSPAVSGWIPPCSACIQIRRRRFPAARRPGSGWPWGWADCCSAPCTCSSSRTCRPAWCG